MKRFLKLFVLSNFSFGVVSGVLACNAPKTTVSTSDNNFNFKPTVPPSVSEGKIVNDNIIRKDVGGNFAILKTPPESYGFVEYPNGFHMGGLGNTTGVLEKIEPRYKVVALYRWLGDYVPNEPDVNHQTGKITNGNEK